MRNLGSSLASIDPFQTLLRMQEALDRVLDNPLEWWSSSLSGRDVFPPVTVLSGQDGYVVRLEVPGLDPSSIQVEVQGDSLKISGKRSIESSAGAEFLRRERWYGEFSRALFLPEYLDVSATQARYRNGVLTLTVPARERAKPRQISVSFTGDLAQLEAGDERNEG